MRTWDELSVDAAEEDETTNVLREKPRADTLEALEAETAPGEPNVLADADACPDDPLEACEAVETCPPLEA